MLWLKIKIECMWTLKFHLSLGLYHFSKGNKLRKKNGIVFSHINQYGINYVAKSWQKVPSPHLFSLKLYWCLKHFDYLSFRVLQFLNFFFDFHLKHLFHFHFHFFHFGYMLPPFFLHLCQWAPAINSEETVS